MADKDFYEIDLTHCENITDVSALGTVKNLKF